MPPLFFVRFCERILSSLEKLDRWKDVFWRFFKERFISPVDKKGGKSPSVLIVFRSFDHIIPL
jgi:hypothetical protein